MNEAMINQAIDYVFFDNDQLSVVYDNDGYFVPIKPISTALGIDWRAHQELIERDPVLSSVRRVIRSTGQDGKQYEMICLPFEYLNGWLFKINPCRYDGARLEKIVRYQKECYQALYQHFFPHSKEPVKHLKNMVAIKRLELADLKTQLAIRKTQLAMEKQAEEEARRIFQGQGSIDDLTSIPKLHALTRAAMDKLNKDSLFPHDPDQAA